MTYIHIMGKRLLVEFPNPHSNDPEQKQLRECIDHLQKFHKNIHSKLFETIIFSIGSGVTLASAILANYSSQTVLIFISAFIMFLFATIPSQKFIKGYFGDPKDPLLDKLLLLSKESEACSTMCLAAQHAYSPLKRAFAKQRKIKGIKPSTAPTTS